MKDRSRCTDARAEWRRQDRKCPSNLVFYDTKCRPRKTLIWQPPSSPQKHRLPPREKSTDFPKARNRTALKVSKPWPREVGTQILILPWFLRSGTPKRAPKRERKHIFWLEPGVQNARFGSIFVGRKMMNDVQSAQERRR